MNSTINDYYTEFDLPEIQAALEHTFYMMQANHWTADALPKYNRLDLALKVKVEVVKFLSDNTINTDQKIMVGVIQLQDWNFLLTAFAGETQYFFNVCPCRGVSDPVVVTADELAEAVYEIF